MLSQTIVSNKATIFTASVLRVDGKITNTKESTQIRDSSSAKSSKKVFRDPRIFQDKVGEKGFTRRATHSKEIYFGIRGKSLKRTTLPSICTLGSLIPDCRWEGLTRCGQLR